MHTGTYIVLYCPTHSKKQTAGSSCSHTCRPTFILCSCRTHISQCRMQKGPKQTEDNSLKQG